MRKTVVTTAMLFLLVYPCLSPAQSPATSKLGVINIQEAIANTQEGKRAFADLQKKYQPRQQKLQQDQQAINALQDQLQKQSATLSDEERLRLTRELDEKQKNFKRDGDDAQSEYQTDSQDIIRRIGQKMLKVISEYAQQNGFSVIMDDAQVPVYYAAKESDVTTEIVKRFDIANPVAGGTSASSSDAPPPSTPPASPAPKPPAKPRS